MKRLSNLVPWSKVWLLHSDQPSYLGWEELGLFLPGAQHYLRLSPLPYNFYVAYLLVLVWKKYHFGPYILWSLSIWSLHFSSSQINPCFFNLQSLSYVFFYKTFMLAVFHNKSDVIHWFISLYFVGFECNGFILKRWKFDQDSWIRD